MNNKIKNKLDLLEGAQTTKSSGSILDSITVTCTEPVYTMEDIYHFSPTEQADYSAYLEAKWSDACTYVLAEMMAWEIGEIYLSTSQQPDYEREIKKQIDLLRHLTPYTENYDFTRIVHDGNYSTSMGGALLGALYPYPEKQKTATIILKKIQWLVEHQNSNKGGADSVGQIPLNEDGDTVLLRKQIEALNLPQSKNEYYPLLYTLKDAWHARCKPWAADNSKFALKIAPILQKKSDTISKGLNRACNLIRKEKAGTGCYPLATLQLCQIDIAGYTNQREELEKWNERRLKIKQVMSLDIAETLTEEKNN